MRSVYSHKGYALAKGYLRLGGLTKRDVAPRPKEHPVKVTGGSW